MRTASLDTYLRYLTHLTALKPAPGSSSFGRVGHIYTHWSNLKSLSAVLLSDGVHVEKKTGFHFRTRRLSTKNRIDVATFLNRGGYSRLRLCYPDH